MPLRKRCLAHLCTIACIAFFFPVAHPREPVSIHLAPASVSIPASYFGIHFHRPAENTWPQIPFAEWRLWDSEGTVWYNLEPHKGDWDFSQLDRDVAMAEQHGVGLLLTLGQTPPWASSRPKEPPAWRPGGTAPPKDEKDWIEYVRKVVTRYKGRIHEYEIWNEPNLQEFFSGSQEQLVGLAQDAYRIIREIDPTAAVVSPSITGGDGVSWLDKYLDLGGGKYADVIGYHFYVSPKAPEAAVEIIQQVQAVLLTHGIRKPIWNTESGWFIHSDFEKPQNGTFSHTLVPEEAISYVMRAYLVNWASGVSRLYWYDWDGNPMGLGDNLGRQKKLAAYGYAAIRQWLVGTTMQRCDKDPDGSWVCELNRDGHGEWIIWSSTTVLRTIPSFWNVRQVVKLSPGGVQQSGNLGSTRAIEYSPVPTLLF
jgi:hypothetical protein